jgi:peptidyl-prolyl cis-trans isomerase B (cyclophilin B)
MHIPQSVRLLWTGARMALPLTAALLLLAPAPCLSQADAPAAPAEAASSPAEATATVDEVALLETDHGIIVFEFHADIAPNHVANFKKLVSQGFYDGTRFHRCIPGFMIQGGDPLTKGEDRSRWGTGGPGYSINAEFNERPHKRGSVSMARSGNPNSAGSQFFICVAPAPHLDRQYSNFGTVISGMNVADDIVALPKAPGTDQPKEPATIKKARVLPRIEALKLAADAEQ